MILRGRERKTMNTEVWFYLSLTVENPSNQNYEELLWITNLILRPPLKPSVGTRPQNQEGGTSSGRCTTSVGAVMSPPPRLVSRGASVSEWSQSTLELFSDAQGRLADWRCQGHRPALLSCCHHHPFRVESEWSSRPTFTQHLSVLSLNTKETLALIFIIYSSYRKSAFVQKVFLIQIDMFQTQGILIIDHKFVVFAIWLR